MSKLNLEITDNQYLIKLSKDEFEYPLLKRFINNLMVSHSLVNSGCDYNMDDDFSKGNSAEMGDRFDYLGDK